MLLDAGADANAQNLLGDTPLYYAAFYRLNEAFYVLLSKGADPNIENCDRLTPLLVAEETALATAMSAAGRNYMFS
jgi:ankyrin repeat protein